MILLAILQHKLLAAGGILLVCAVLCLLLRRKTAKVIALAVGCLLLCIVVSAKQKEVKREQAELPTWERKSEYRFPGGADLSRIKERIDEFLSKHTSIAESDPIWMRKREAYLSTEIGTVEYHYTAGSILYSSKDDRFYEFLQYDLVNEEGWHAARDVVPDPID